MRIVEAVCETCAQRGPVAMFATLADGTQLALCRDCSEVPERAQAFVARYQAGRHLMDTANHVGAEPSTHGTSNRPPDRAAN